MIIKTQRTTRVEPTHHVRYLSHATSEGLLSNNNVKSKKQEIPRMMIISLINTVIIIGKLGKINIVIVIVIVTLYVTF